MAADLSSLRYADEKDRCFGIAGMTITLVAVDGEELLRGVSLDTEDGENILLTDDFYFKGNPRMSAKTVWVKTVENLRIVASMMLGNICCRRYILQGNMNMDDDISEALRELVREEARTSCSLETDEADRIFNRSLRDVRNIFAHSAVHDMARDFASALQDRRSLHLSEIMDILRR